MPLQLETQAYPRLSRIEHLALMCYRYVEITAVNLVPKD